MKSLCKIIATGILGVGLVLNSFGCATRKGAGIETAVSKNKEKPVISSLSEAEINSLIDSELNKETQTRVNMLYCMSMLIDNKKQIKQEIDKFADYCIGNFLGTYDGKADKLERDITYFALFDVLKTVVDFNGNRNRKAESQEINNYFEKFKDKPLVQVIREYIYR